MQQIDPNSDLYSADLAPVEASHKTWNWWHMTAIWIGMAVCIPTYLLASYMIKSGLGWVEALVIIFVANIIVTVPMVLNGKAGVDYGVPFPVLGRAAFGVFGVHIPAIVRAIVACGWFGIQTWIGGLAFYAIGCAALGITPSSGLSLGQFIGFGLFWLVNLYFIWKGTESIRWLESWAAPILLGIGLLLIIWGASGAGGFAKVLDQSAQMQRPAASLQTNGNGIDLVLTPLTKDGATKATQFQITAPIQTEWLPMTERYALGPEIKPPITLQFGHGSHISNPVKADFPKPAGSPWDQYLFWLTAMVGFWATMSISISDITRFAKTQRDQTIGQFLGLPGTMLLYSFVGVFVTCATLVMFDDILIADDAPWDPVSLLGKFKSPSVVIGAQFFMIIATLSTNIAANVIAPANAFANLLPRHLNFKSGGLITGLLGIAICPWWLLNEISNLLIFVSGLLGPVLGVMLSDYFLVKKGRLSVADLFTSQGIYRYTSGFNLAALIALTAGVITALIGYWIPKLSMLYTLSWFSGFAVAFVVYWLLMRIQTQNGGA
ncbi:MAG: NCS1 family nucleobase:cation symporter-1 [Acidobacteria bacterium]|nr:NCS1 family nucleobase:cation symporter-1 [Acidobacteriota bacterium]